MAPRSKISKLPPDVKKWLDRALSDKNFGEYELLEQALAERGHQISKSAIHRYGQKLERKLAAIKASTEAAAAIAAAAPDDADLRSAAVISLVQSEVFEVLVALQEAEADSDPAERIKLLGSAAKSIAELSRASVNQKKWQAQVREKAAAAAAAVEKIAKKGGLSASAVNEIRSQILGIPS